MRSHTRRQGDREKLTSEVTKEVSNRDDRARVDERASDLDGLVGTVGRDGLLNEHLRADVGVQVQQRVRKKGTFLKKPGKKEKKKLTAGVFLGKCLRI